MAATLFFFETSTDPLRQQPCAGLGGLARRLYRTAEADSQQRVSKVLAGPAKPFVLRPENAGSSSISSADETIELMSTPLRH